ncbi:MAG: family 20 glycosylhydrolase [Clostridiaceae bacterium]|nr:family 20 glycosylhydrolase [Clostridiaceae bacterium]
MFIGRLPAVPAFFHRGTTLPFPPDAADNAVYTWNWDTVYDTGIDIALPLTREAFVGAVRFTLAPDAEINSALVLADGKPAGILDARDSKPLTGEITVPVGVTAKSLTLRLGADLKKIALSTPEVLGAYEDDAPFVFPTAQSLTVTPGAPVRLGEIRASSSVDTAFAADYLLGRLPERFGDWFSPAGVPVTLCIDESYQNERYRVEITSTGVTLTAGARLPLLYAIETLLSCGDAGNFTLCSIDDVPYKPMRGFHFGLPPRSELGFARRLIRYVLIPMRYNQLFIEFAGGMRFDSHPEISAAWLEGNRASKEHRQPPFPHGEMVAGGELLEKDEVRAFLGYARDFGFEIIPEVQSFGHVQYITYAHPEIAEREDRTNIVGDTRGEDARPPEFYAHCYCPSLEESYRIIYDLIDEIVDVASPQHFVHMGHDEIYQVGVCPRCKDLDRADLYCKHVTAMHDYLARKGLRMMIWADMLHPTMRYGTPLAITRLPRDIVLLDFVWYFHFDSDIEDRLLSSGYKVLMGNLYSSHYPRYTARAAKPHMLGGQVSTWCRLDEYTLAKKGKFWDLLYTAEMLWNPAYDEGQRVTYSHLLASRLQPALRDLIRGVSRTVPAVKTALPLPDGDRAALPAALLDLAPAAIPADGAEVFVNGTCRRLVFEHTTLWNLPRIAWQPLPVIGAYTIRYADGGTESIPVEYNGNVLAWDRRYADPLPQQYYRHQGYVGTWRADPTREGKDSSGRDTLICGFVWENPDPSRVIASVRYDAAQTDAAILILAGITAIH